MNAEVLFELCKVDLFSQSGAFDLVHDSTFHILSIWAMTKAHNSLYLTYFTEFFVNYCKKANNLSLINAFIKTNLIADLANFFMDNIFGASNVSKYKETFSSFFYEVVTSIQNIKAVIVSFDPREVSAAYSLLN